MLDRSQGIFLPGAKIGNNCIVAAGSVVPNKSYPDYSLIVGNPAQVKKIFQWTNFKTKVS